MNTETKMENRATDKIEKLKSRLSEYVKRDVIKLYALTDSSGFEIGSKQKKFYEKALRAAETKKYQKENETTYWIPLIFDKQIIAVCGLKSNDAYPKSAAQLLGGLIDEIAFDEFLERQISQTIDQNSKFISDLLTTDKFQTFEEAIDRGDILGINLRAPQAVILVKIPGHLKKTHGKYKKYPKQEVPIKIMEERHQLVEDLSAAFKNYEQNIFVNFGQDLYVCLKWARGQVNTLNTINFFRTKAEYIQEIVEKKTKIKPTIGVGQYYSGLLGLKKSYSDARVALKLGEKIWGPGKIYHIVDVGMFVALTPEITFERKCELAHQIMGKIFSDQSLYKTVNVFLEKDMNLSLAASILHLHRNTLIYRLNKVKQTIGLDPRKFSDAVQLKLGLILYDPNKECDKRY
jgi:carbohydrate diacid regulator